MVNYCCVNGCGRNSRQSKHLNYYSLPKERERQIQWLKAGGREDLLEKSQVKLTYRFCSRHFPPSSIKNKHLCADAMPTLFLPGVNNELDIEEVEPKFHPGIYCNSCKDQILGFRYKCVNCEDYDLCSKCEMSESHSKHFMLRISKPMKFKDVDKLMQKWKKLFKSEHVTVDSYDSDLECNFKHSDSSDDEPITKYVRQYDSGIDLSDDVREKIKKEVDRVLSLKEPVEKKSKKKTQKKGEKRKVEEGSRSSKRIKINKSAQVVEDDDNKPDNVPEMVFVDEPVVDVKNEALGSGTSAVDEPATEPHLMHVKLSDDLTQLLIEIPGTNQRTVYKF